ncbi:hypothetical protein [Sphingobium yanoikuyae]|uniref:hypothetical protein n=1 Tax=Sphingobium yanoikuyae TaxID=13690 RepID=UPI002FDEDA5E
MTMPPVRDSDVSAEEALSVRADHVRERANWMRRRLLAMIVEAGQGHPGGDLGA